MRKKIFIHLPAAFLCLTLVCAGNDDPAAKQEKESPKKVSSAILALEARLKALEEEEKSLSEMSDKLTNGEELSATDIWDSWLPPAVYLVDLTDEDPQGEITGAAAGNARKILEEKDNELEQLYALKTELEGGEAEKQPPVLEELEVLGLESPDKVLDKEMEELEAMRTQLQRLRFHERFQRSADLGEAMEDDQVLLQDVPLTRTMGEQLQPEAQGEGSEATAVDSELKIAVNLVKLAESCYQAGRYDKALKVFSDIDSASHTEGDRILYMMGRCSERIGDLKAARDLYNEVGKVYPDSFWAGEAKFAVNMVDWKEEIGQVKGLPPEVLRVLGYSTTTIRPKQSGLDNE